MASGEIRQPAAGRHGKPTLRLVRDRACEDRGTRTVQGSSVSSRNHPGPRLRIAAPAPCEDHGPTLSAPIPAAPRPGSAHEVTGWSDQRLFRPVAGAWGGGVAIAEDATATATFASIWAVPAESDRPMRFGLVIADLASQTIHLHRTRCPRFGEMNRRIVPSWSVRVRALAHLNLTRWYPGSAHLKHPRCWGIATDCRFPAGMVPAPSSSRPRGRNRLLPNRRFSDV